jgi:hypothetical protein
VKKVDPSKTPQFKPGSNCANCVQLTGKEGDEWRPCNLFPRGIADNSRNKIEHFFRRRRV